MREVMTTDIYVDGLGHLGAGELKADPVRFALSPRMIPGGRNASELVMLPEDMDPAAPVGDIIQPKANGIRSLALDGTIVTREGVPMNCALKALTGLERIQKEIGLPMVFDGEWVEPGGFNKTLAAFRRGAGEGIFWIFDAVPFAEWSIDRCTEPLIHRLSRLEAALGAACSRHVGLLEWTPAEQPSHVKFLAERAWKRGLEGIVSKKSMSRYQRRRSGDWRRWKQFVTVDCSVIDTIHAGGQLRKIMCRGPDGPLMIGTGWSAAEARRLEIDPNPVIEVAYTPDPDNGKMRHARFFRFRDDKKGDVLK